MDVVANRSAPPRRSPSVVRRRLPPAGFPFWLVLVLLLGAGGVPLALDADPDTRLDINTATAEELAERLPGIGQVKAGAIVDWREANGPFDSVDALIEVPGIGPVTLERLRPLITVGGAIGEAADARERATVLAVRRIVERARRAAGD